MVSIWQGSFISLEDCLVNCTAREIIFNGKMERTFYVIGKSFRYPIHTQPANEIFANQHSINFEVQPMAVEAINNTLYCQDILNELWWRKFGPHKRSYSRFGSVACVDAVALLNGHGPAFLVVIVD